MGRSPCCSKEGVNRGAWTAVEDKILASYIQAHGEGKWRNLPKRAGLKRCGKSCRLRWLNYLRPDIKRGNISHDEEELIIRLHNLLGNRWSLIAGRLPGRTDNEIKNYWNTTLGKKVKAEAEACYPTISSENSPTASKSRHYYNKKLKIESQVADDSPVLQATENEKTTQVIRTKATRCSRKLVLPPEADQGTDNINNLTLDDDQEPWDPELQDYHRPCLTNHQEMDITTKVRTYHGNQVARDHSLNAGGPHSFEINDQMQAISNGESEENRDINKNLSEDPVQSMPFDEAILFKDWTTNNHCLNHDNTAIHLDSLAFLLDLDEWPFDS